MVYVLSVVHNYDCDVTATRNEHVHFSARLQEVAANHNAGIGMSVVDQLWRHCLLFFFARVSVNKGNLLLAVMFIFNYVDFIRYRT